MNSLARRPAHRAAAADAVERGPGRSRIDARQEPTTRLRQPRIPPEDRLRDPFGLETRRFHEKTSLSGAVAF